MADRRPGRIQRLKKGDKISAELWNDMADRFESLMNLSVAPPLNMQFMPSGVALGIDLDVQSVAYIAHPVTVAAAATLQADGHYKPEKTADEQVGIYHFGSNGEWKLLLRAPVYNPLGWELEDDVCWVRPSNGLWLVERPFFWGRPACRATATNYAGGSFFSFNVPMDTLVYNQGGAFEIVGGELRCKALTHALGTFLQMGRVAASLELIIEDAGASDEYDYQVGLGVVPAGGPSGGGSTDRRMWRREAAGQTRMTFHGTYVGPMNGLTTITLSVSGTVPTSGRTVAQATLDVNLL